MKISEMERHHSEYLSLEQTIRQMLGNREFPSVFSFCVASLPHIVPAIQFRKKRGIEPQTPGLICFDVVCKYAPALFEHAVIESAVDHVRSQRQLARHENGYLSALEAAFEEEECARRLWNHIETNPGTPQRCLAGELALDHTRVDRVVRLWEELGIIQNQDESGQQGLRLLSALDAEAEGICQACGVRAKGRRRLFYAEIKCKWCGAIGHYYIVSSLPH